MRRLLVKRFESSFGSFACSISNFEHVHEIVLDFIKQSGGKYVLDRQLIERIYEDDPEEIEVSLQEFAENLKRQKRIPKHERVYNIADFDQKDKFLSDIQSDLELMREINSELQKLHLIDNDSKAYRLIDQIRYVLNEPCLDNEHVRKIVIFTEYVDTVNHLQPLLEQAFSGKVLTLSGNLTIGLSKDILDNFDASIPAHKQKDKYQLLLTSDKLSEGVNLNRAGAVINYDIPWNPTRVIQRVGRINRIGKKVFNTLYIYNFFPTQKGADIIKSREIASQKMFLIHTTLGEDAKIFDIDEAPSPAELYRRVNCNPEEEEDESLFTQIRRKYFEIQRSHPEIIERVAQYPARVKTAKSFNDDQLIVFRRKGLGLFIQTVENTLADKKEITSVLLEDELSKIECQSDEPLLSLSPHFWSAYEAVKLHRDPIRSSGNENSLEVKAFNNLNYALEKYKTELESYLPFIRMLIKDLREYRTIPKFTLRRLVSVDLHEDHLGLLPDFIQELEEVRRYLGEDYLDIIQQRALSMETEIIIAVENIKISRN
jgi:SNF2 family DNA or RNA helicase